MPLTCPACHKANQTASICQRCGCDLSTLQEIEIAAATRFYEAHTALTRSDWPTALALAESSWRLRHRVATARLAYLAAIGCGNFSQAFRWRERVNQN